jgi:hypothetical protein
MPSNEATTNGYAAVVARQGAAGCPRRHARTRVPTRRRACAKAINDTKTGKKAAKEASLKNYMEQKEHGELSRQRAWAEWSVNPAKDHFELRYGSADDPD